jgi:hypothetical protein
MLVHFITNLLYQNIKCYLTWQPLPVLARSHERHVAVSEGSASVGGSARRVVSLRISKSACCDTGRP